MKVICELPWTDLLVRTDGDCFNCCHQSKAMGNASEGVSALWNGVVAQATRRDMLDGKVPEACKGGIGSCVPLGRK